MSDQPTSFDIVRLRDGSGCQVRRYRAEDCEAVWSLHNLALQETPNAYAGNGPWDDDLRQIDETYLANGGDFLVCLCGDRVVAMGALKRTDSERAEIKRMRVHPAYWRQGIGQAILTALEQRAAEMGYRALHLDTTIHQKAAQELYRRNGYREVGREPQGRFECILYEKDIS